MPRRCKRDMLRSSSNMDPQHVNMKAVEIRETCSKAHFSSAGWLVHVLSNQARGVHV